MEVVGNFETMQEMINVLKRDLKKELQPLKADLKKLRKEHDRMYKEDIGTSLIVQKIRKVERKIEAVEIELDFLSAKYLPVRIYDVVINYKLLKSILLKTKKFNVVIQKGQSDTLEIVWDGKESRGKYTLNNLADHYVNLVYIPELRLEAA